MTPHTILFRLLTVGAAAAQSQAAPATAETYPPAIYPTGKVELKASELPPPPAAGGCGYSQPFPEIQRRVFRVEDYGARADGVTDCTPAFVAALTAAKSQNSPSEILFASGGRYRFRPSRKAGSDDLATLTVQNARNLLIRGRGTDTVLMMTDPALGGLAIRNSEMVMVRNLAIDYCILPFTQGTVTAVDSAAGWLTLQLTPGYPTPKQIADAIPGEHGGYRLDRSADGAYRWPAIGGLAIEHLAETAPGEWRLSAAPAALVDYVHKGDDFVYVGRRLAQTALSAVRTRAFYVKNVAVFASPTCGLLLSSVDGALIDGYADMIPPGSNRMLASNADGLYGHGVRGGITVHDSFFSGQGDDCINLHCPAYKAPALTIVSDTEVSIATDDDLRPDDQLEVMDPTVGRIKGTLRLAAVTAAPDDRRQRLRLAAGLSTVGFDPKTDCLYPTAIAGSDFRIAHNYFGQNRSRCLLIQARHGIIEANTFENAEGYGVTMGYGGTQWPEGVIPADVTIRGNLFRNVTNVGLAAAIEAYDGSAFRNFSKLVIADNRFVNPRKMAIRLSGVTGARLTGNIIETTADRRNTWNHPQWYPVDCCVFLDNCAGVEVRGLRVREPNVREAALFIGGACDPGAKGVVVEGLTADIPAGVPAVRDERPKP